MVRPLHGPTTLSVRGRLARTETQRGRCRLRRKKGRHYSARLGAQQIFHMEVAILLIGEPSNLLKACRSSKARKRISGAASVRSRMLEAGSDLITTSHTRPIHPAPANSLPTPPKSSHPLIRSKQSVFSCYPAAHLSACRIRISTPKRPPLSTLLSPHMAKDSVFVSLMAPCR